MSKWGHNVEVGLGILTGVFITAGVTQMKETQKLGWLFIVLGCLSFVAVVVALVKGRKRYGVAELASDMETTSANLADFVEERGRSDPTNRIKMRHEGWEDQRRELIEYGSETMRIYRRRFAGKVRYLVKEARRLGYQDKDLDSVYERPVNRLGIEMLSDKMRALSLRMKKEIK